MNSQNCHKSRSHLKIIDARRVTEQVTYSWPKYISRHRTEFSRPGDLDLCNPD